jgi:hypothetical protein
LQVGRGSWGQQVSQSGRWCFCFLVKKNLCHWEYLILWLCLGGGLQGEAMMPAGKVETEVTRLVSVAFHWQLELAAGIL